MIFKNIFRQIKRSLGRFIAIFAIVALGVGFFVGLRVSKDAMVKTGGNYFEELKLYDFRLISTLGLTSEDVAAFANRAEVESAVGSVNSDVMYIKPDGSNGVLHVHSLLSDMNLPDLRKGRMPQAADECVIDNKFYSDAILDSYIELSKDNSEDTLDTFKYDKYKVVGVVNSPYYVNFERGSSSLGGVSGYVYILPDGFETDYYTEIFVRMNERYEVYSKECEDYTEKCQKLLESVLEERGNIRFEALRAEAFDEIHEAEEKLADGKKEYEEKKADANKEIADAEDEINDGASELTDAEQKIADGEKELEAAKVKLADGREQLADAKQQIADGEKQLTDAKSSLQDGFSKVEEAKEQLEAGKSQLEEGKAQLAAGRSQLEAAKAQLEAAKPMLTPEMIAEQESVLVATETELSLKEAILLETETEILTQEETLNATIEYLDGQQKLLTEQEQTLNSQKKQLAEKEQELRDNEALVAENEEELSNARLEIADKKQELENAKTTLAEKKQEAEEEFAKAEAELLDAQIEIDDAYKKVEEELKAPTTFVLGRSTNVGYVSLENDTDIVAGIAKVFPLFFFIVASLVCMTTMTRMVDEQRVQNGTLKALGYSDFVIAGQYLFYAGSASITGCIVGFLVGSKFMPLVLWKIYHIMYSIERPIVYLLDWKLFFICVAIYLVATLGATWMAASGDLREAAAELIRPKAPAAGKRVILERIPFIWKRLKFLHKVSVRNILRYKKRMFMMIIGVGGCTALLLTGYGIRDSIQPILDYQFGEIHTYDLTVAYKEAQSEADRRDFEQEYKEDIEKIAFVHMEAMDLMTNGSADSASVVVADNLDKSLVNLHNGAEVYNWPGKNETIIDYRLAKDNGIEIGDTIEFRNSDYQVLTLKVVGIFDNYLRDYAYVSTETYEGQLGKASETNTAYLNIPEGKDGNEVATKLLKDSQVTSVNVTANQIETVGNMLSSLDYVVLLVLVCAGALAFIVIYNLTNISINERIREIATIKVLGFHEGEAAAYVFRENLVLTVISSLVGLPMGVALHRYVMSQIKIKSMYFGHHILPISFVWAVIITFAFAVIVDIFMYFKLKKINMAESLKAVD